MGTDLMKQALIHKVDKRPKVACVPAQSVGSPCENAVEFLCANIFQKLDENVQDELLAQVILLRTFGPSLGRPSVDTLKGSIHANMKELRFKTPDGVWRVAFDNRLSST